jgi:hypothetical protein
MHDGAEKVSDLGDRIPIEFFNRIGFSDLLHPARDAPGVSQAPEQVLDAVRVNTAPWSQGTTPS